MTPSRADEGSGSVLVLAVAAATMLVCGLLLPLYMGLAAKRQIAGAADAAALAAADGLSGAVPGVPCELAGQVAALNTAAVASCEVAGTEVIVVTVGEVLGLPVQAAARAGPPG
ncbi:Rv3654c family TadE-like protein [Naasia sp. SYSU D00948]|uniref:Rv3654c family TadE-like protein n=1 Tax=Naasia sp. SYSU D00948 TaxID=2817379 RepID=UPI001B30EFF2|nr:Rv3654c family TadE-like protein [Naasia sp. SYSU D00948]